MRPHTVQIPDDLLRETSFAPAERPAKVVLPDDVAAPAPTLGLHPRGRGFGSAAILLSFLLHGALLYLAWIAAPLDGLSSILSVARSPHPTTLMRFFFVEQPPAPPPAHPPRTARGSDLDRMARGGEVLPGEPARPNPRLHGESARLVYEPERGHEGSAAADVQGPHSDRLARERSSRDKLGVSDMVPLMTELPSYQSIGHRSLFGSGEVASTPDGGSGTEGTVSFETSWYEWGEYAAAMLRKIKWNWIPPHALYVGVKGHVRVSFVIERSGAIVDVRLDKPSGTSSYDEAALQAIRGSSPLQPLPRDFPFERERVTINFLYNMSRMAANQGTGTPPSGS